MVEDWFGVFVASIEQRIPLGWPPVEDEFWVVLKRVLINAGANQEVADEALFRVAESGAVKFANEFVEPLRKTIGEVWREKDSTGHAPDSREAAKAHPDSRACTDCGGEGMTSRYLHDPNHPRHGTSYALYCNCPIGRWIERNHREKQPEIRKRMRALADYPQLQLGPVDWSDAPDNKHRIPPRMWNDADGCPIYVDPRGFAADIAARNGPARKEPKVRTKEDILRETPRPVLGRATPAIPIAPKPNTPEPATDGRS